MSYNNWSDRVNSFDVLDVRNIKGNFFPMIKKRAENVEVGNGMKIIQTFEPHPLYSTMEGLGFERHTEEVSNNEFHVYFYRVEKLGGEENASPFKPIALLNFPMIDEDLGSIAVDFWNVTWKSEKRTIPYEMRLLLSLTNAVGAGRMRQATRELIKAYSHGVSSKMFDDVFELIAWDQGIGFFASEVGPSELFKAYALIKAAEDKGREHHEIMTQLMEKFGEKNKNVSVQ